MVQETDNNGSENQIARGQDNEPDPGILQPASDSDVTTTNRDSHDSLEQASDVTKVENVESHDTQQHDVCHPPSNASPKAQETSASNATRATEGLADCGILAGVFLANTITGLNFTGFPVFYPYLVEHFEATNAAVAWCGSIHGFFQAFVSLFASYPIEVYGCRLPSVIGSLLFCVGMTLSCFAPDLNTIYITYGLIAGSGTAVYMLAVGIIVHQRFNRNRTLASGIALLGFSFGSSVGSFATNLLLQRFNWRSTFLILGAINAHRIPVCLLFRTPKRFTSSPAQTSQRITRHVLGRYFKDIFDFSMLKHGRYSACVAASTLQVFCHSAFIFHTVNRAINVGLTSVQGVAAATVTSLANMVSRATVSFTANIQGVNPLHIYGIGMFTAVLSIVTICTSPGFVGTMVAHVLFGMCLGCTTTVTSTMIVHLMGVSSLPKCLAILQFASGFPRLLSAPLIGWVFDVTRDYSIAYSIIGCMAFVSGSLVVVLTFVTRCHQRKSVAKDSESPS